MSVLDTRPYHTPHLFSYPVNAHELYEVGHVSIQERGSSVSSIAATVNFLHPKYQHLQVVRSRAGVVCTSQKTGSSAGMVAEQGHEAVLTTTVSAVLPVPPHGIPIARQPCIQWSYFLRQHPSQEFHLTCLWGTVWATSLMAWHLEHFSERKTWGLPSSWSLPPEERKFAPLGAKGDLLSPVLWIFLQSACISLFSHCFHAL